MTRSATRRIHPVTSHRAAVAMIATALILTTGAATAQLVVPEGFDAEEYLAGPPFTQITGLAADAGHLYVADDGADVIHKVDLTSRDVLPLVTGLPLGSPGRMLVGDGRTLLGTDLILADWNSVESGTCCDGRVFRFDRVTGAHAEVAAGNPLYDPGDPKGLALAPAGPFPSGLYVMDFMGAATDPPVLYRVNDDGSDEVVFSDAAVWSVNRSPTDIVFGTTGSFAGLLFVADPSGNGGPPTIWSLAPGNAPIAFCDDLQLARPIAQAFGPGDDFGTDLFVLDTNAGAVFTVDSGGNLAPFATEVPLSIDGDLTFSADGRSLFVAVGAAIYRVFPESATAAEPEIASAPRLLGNHPNPFNPSTTISFELATETAVSVRVFGADGRLVRTLWSGRLPAAVHALDWDGRDDAGNAVGSGTYFTRLEAGKRSWSDKMTLVK